MGVEGVCGDGQGQPPSPVHPGWEILYPAVAAYVRYIWKGVMHGTPSHLPGRNLLNPNLLLRAETGEVFCFHLYRA